MARRPGPPLFAKIGPTRKFRWPSIPVLTCASIGILSLLLAGSWAWGSYRFAARAMQAPGKVVRIAVEYTKRTDRKASSTGPMYCPVVRFITADERTVEFTGMGASEPDYEVGDEVTVLYNRHDPQRGKISSFQELWLGPVVFLVLAALFGGIALLMVKIKF